MLEKLIKEHGGLESALESLDRKGSVKALFPTAFSKKNKEAKTSNNTSKDESLNDDSKKDVSENNDKDIRLKLLLSAKQECTQ